MIRSCGLIAGRFSRSIRKFPSGSKNLRTYGRKTEPGFKEATEQDVAGSGHTSKNALAVDLSKTTALEGNVGVNDGGKGHVHRKNLFTNRAQKGRNTPEMRGSSSTRDSVHSKSFGQHRKHPAQGMHYGRGAAPVDNYKKRSSTRNDDNRGRHRGSSQPKPPSLKGDIRTIMSAFTAVPSSVAIGINRIHEFDLTEEIWNLTKGRFSTSMLVNPATVFKKGKDLKKFIDETVRRRTGTVDREGLQKVFHVYQKWLAQVRSCPTVLIYTQFSFLVDALCVSLFFR